MIKQITPWEQRFVDTVGLGGAEWSTPRGIWLSEMFAFCALASHFDVSLIVESGVYLGQSTEIMARYFKDDPDAIRIRACDHLLKPEAIERLAPYPHVRLYNHDARTWAARALMMEASEAAAVLLDGPKGYVAITLAFDLMGKFRHLKFVAIHDLYTPSPGLAPNLPRKELDALGDAFWASDHGEFVAKFRYMDEGRHGAWLDEHGRGKLPFKLVTQDGELSLASYGPTLGFIFPSDRRA